MSNNIKWLIAFEIIVPGATIIMLAYGLWKLYRRTKEEGQ